ncbi:MAG: alpha/beta hydrolase [Planctomycetes bacterium]|nr:alpha/beta hydrolase [Planctomycetota bacterium]
MIRIAAAVAAVVLVSACLIGTAAAEANREVVYKKTPQGDLKMYIHLPSEWKTDDRRPAIVFFFGGGWQSGKVEQFEPQATYLATRGMVTARADYRVKSRHNVTPDACVEDAKSAVRWIRQHAAELGVDPNRIAAGGGSAGGHLAACTALAPGLDAKDEDASISSKPNALLLYNPVVDLTGLGQHTAGLDAKVVEAISPIRYVTKDTPPAIVFFGTADRLLPHGQALLAKAKEHGNRVELYTAEGQPHGFFNRPPWQPLTTILADRFLASIGYLKGEPTLEPPADTKAALKKEP